MSTAGDQMTTEDYDRSSKRAKDGVLVMGRMMVEAAGENASMDDLKAAVAGVGPSRLAALVHGYRLCGRTDGAG